MFIIIILIEINREIYREGMVFAPGKLPHYEKIKQEDQRRKTLKARRRRELILLN
jgi:hypothetical protein